MTQIPMEAVSTLDHSWCVILTIAKKYYTLVLVEKILLHQGGESRCVTLAVKQKVNYSGTHRDMPRFYSQNGE